MAIMKVGAAGIETMSGAWNVTSALPQAGSRRSYVRTNVRVSKFLSIKKSSILDFLVQILAYSIFL